MLEVVDINLPIISTSVQIEKTPRIAAFASENVSLHRYYDSLLSSCNKHEATNRNPCGNENNKSTATFPKIIKQRTRTKNEHKPEEVFASALDALLQIMEESYLGTLQNTSDASAFVRIDKLHARLLLLRPSSLQKLMQICLLWREKNFGEAQDYQRSASSFA